MESRLRIVNNLLTIAVSTLALYLLLSPLLPQFAFWFRDKSPQTLAPYGGSLAIEIGSSTDNPAPSDNRIVIPAIGLNEPILTGNSINIIRDGGTWLRPNTAVPPEQNNSVIVAHRFYGNSVSTFYNLDKLKLGDALAVYWEGEEIFYRVVETKTVSPDSVAIEAPTDTQQLTLYTCTPLWSATQRLVVIAKPVSGEPS